MTLGGAQTSSYNNNSNQNFNAINKTMTVSERESFDSQTHYLNRGNNNNNNN